MSDEERGLYRKFHVERKSDPNGRHPNCDYFVIDVTHDPHARAALGAYADACEATHPALAADLRRFIEIGDWNVTG